MTDIYELYLEYKNKEVDDNFFNRAFECYLNDDITIKPFIKDFKITNKNATTLGTYSNESKIITINKKNINNNEIGSKNVLGLQVLRHELEHAKNLRKLYQMRDDIESKVILYSLRNYSISNHLEYKPNFETMDLLMLILSIQDNYETNPGERIADIKAWKYIVNLLKNQRRTDDLLLARSMLYHSYIRGYKDNRYYLDCPTFTFLSNTRQLEELKRLKNRIDNKDYSLDTRLLCGLPIRYCEKDVDALRKVRLQKKTLR